LLTKIDKTGDVKCVPGSGRPRTAVTEEIAEEVEEMICSQEEFPGTHKSQRKISETLNISQSSVSRISSQCLGLTAYRKTKVQDLSD